MISNNTNQSNVKSTGDFNYSSQTIENGGKFPRPSPLLVKALYYVDLFDIRFSNQPKALDLGSGDGRDSFYLAQKNFFVTSIDKNSHKIDKINSYKISNIIGICTHFETYDFKPNTFDLINAQWSLSFIPQKQFTKTFKKIQQSLKPNGIFCANFFGSKDDWYKNPKLTFHTKAQISKIIQDKKTLYFAEQTFIGQTQKGKTKTWHVFEIIHN